MTPFRSKYRITQRFGVNADYYKQFGLKAHEGIDIVPTGTVWDVNSLTNGVVVRDEDNPRSGAYGVYVTIWNKERKIALQYCHLKSNLVRVGQAVKKGERIGTMGSTGNSTGAHLHLNMFKVDANGIRLNRNNGYLGGVDPLPFLEGGDPDMANQEELDKCFTDRDLNWNVFNKVMEAIGVKADPNDKNGSAESAVKAIAQFKNTTEDVRALKEELKTTKEAYEKQISTLNALLTEKQELIDKLQNAPSENEDLLKEQIKAKDNQIQTMAEQIQKLEAGQTNESCITQLVHWFKELWR